MNETEISSLSKIGVEVDQQTNTTIRRIFQARKATPREAPASRPEILNPHLFVF
jgi:hypothetical protein